MNGNEYNIITDYSDWDDQANYKLISCWQIYIYI